MDPPPPVGLKIVLSSPPAPPLLDPLEEMGSVFALAELVTTLELHGSGVEPFIDFLSSPAGGQRMIHWPLPRLQALFLEDCGLVAGPLLQMIHSRRGRGASGLRGNAEAGGQNTRIAPTYRNQEFRLHLEFISITGRNNMSRSEVIGLETVLGRGNVECDTFRESDDESDSEAGSFSVDTLG